MKDHQSNFPRASTRAGYFCRDPKGLVSNDEHPACGTWPEMKLVNDIRVRVPARVTRTTSTYWITDAAMASENVCSSPLYLAQRRHS
jgi:hypothetical protein